MFSAAGYFDESDDNERAYSVPGFLGHQKDCVYRRSLLRHDEDPDESSTDARSKVSDDGNTMTDEMTAKAKDGKELKQKVTYHRVTGRKDAKKAGA